MLYEFPKFCFKTTERHSLAVYGSFFGEKNFWLIFIPFYWFDQKQLLIEIHFFLRICQFQTWFEKQTFYVFLCSFLRESHLCLKWNVLYEFLQNCFKTTKRHNLTVCGSLCWEKQFLLIFIPFLMLDQKQLFRQIQILIRICPFHTWWEKIFFCLFQFSFLR